MKNLILRLKTAFSSEKFLRSSVFAVNGKGDAKRQPFSFQNSIYAYRSWIYAAANLNAVAVASVPLRLYVRKRSEGTKLFRTSRVPSRTKAYLAGDLGQSPSLRVMRKVAEYGDDFEVVTDTHPVLDLLSKVNPYQNGYDATILRVLYTELTGNAYLHPVIDPNLRIPVQLWTMPSQYVEIVPGSERFIEGYLYGVTREQRKAFAPEEIIHFKRPNPGDMYYGIGKVEAAWPVVQMNHAIHEMDLSFFENKARPDYLVSIRSDASSDELERLEVMIDEKLRGTRRTGRFLTTTADIDLKPLSFPPKDLQGREDVVEEIAAIFGVPVSMLKANDPNLASATQGFATWKETTILPMLRMDEEVLNQNLLPLFGIEDDAFLCYDNPIPQDKRFDLEQRRSAVAGGWMTVNEARIGQGLDKSDDPNADRLLVGNQPLGGPPAPVPGPPAGGPVPGLPAEPMPLEASSEPLGIDTKQDDECVSSKIPKLLDEGYDRDQAIAIAFSMCKEGKTLEDALASLPLEPRSKALSDIDTVPPASVADNARRALEVRQDKPSSQRGMTATGIARARDLANRVSLSEQTIRRMLSYFERHEVDKQGSTWDEQGPGWQAWNGWGGDEGFRWSRRKVDEFDRQREATGAKSFGEAIEPATMASKDCGTGSGGFKPGNTCGEEGGGSGESSSGAARSRSQSERIDRNREADANAASKSATISPDEVESFVRDSEYREIATHVTKQDAASAIAESGFKVTPSDAPNANLSFGRVWGDGVYLGTDDATTEFYREIGQSSGVSEVVRTAVDIRNPLEITYDDEPDITKEGPSAPRRILKAAGLDDEIPNLEKELDALSDRQQNWTQERRRLIRETVDPFVPKESDQAWKIVQSIPEPELEAIRNLGMNEFNAKLEERVRREAGPTVADALFARKRLIDKIEQDPLPPDPGSFSTAFVTRKLQEAGYDSIIVRNKGNLRASGGNQIVVFDPKRVKVVK